jgi:hypothetical protein
MDARGKYKLKAGLTWPGLLGEDIQKPERPVSPNMGRALGGVTHAIRRYCGVAGRRKAVSGDIVHSDMAADARAPFGPGNRDEIFPEPCAVAARFRTRAGRKRQNGEHAGRDCELAEKCGGDRQIHAVVSLVATAVGDVLRPTILP